MPRKFRIVIAGHPHHVVQRGNRRQVVFFSSEDKKEYLRLLKEQVRRQEVLVWAYCLMDNHVHLILVPNKEEALAKAVAETNRRFTCIINRRNEWRGYLWQGRFLSSVMDDVYLLRALHYVENNPVRAGMVKKAWEYPWSSARAHVLGHVDDLLSDIPSDKRIRDWKEFLVCPAGERELDEVRKNSRAGLPLGEKFFVERLAKRLGLETAALYPRSGGRPRKT